MYRLFVYEGTELDKSPYWHDSEEGPWESYDDAARFAAAECGVAWVIVNQHGYPIAFGDCRGMEGGREVTR